MQGKKGTDRNPDAAGCKSSQARQWEPSVNMLRWLKTLKGITWGENRRQESLRPSGDERHVWREEYIRWAYRPLISHKIRVRYIWWLNNLKNIHTGTDKIGEELEKLKSFLVTPGTRDNLNRPAAEVLDRTQGQEANLKIWLLSFHPVPKSVDVTAWRNSTNPKERQHKETYRPVCCDTITEKTGNKQAAAEEKDRETTDKRTKQRGT